MGAAVEKWANGIDHPAQSKVGSVGMGRHLHIEMMALRSPQSWQEMSNLLCMAVKTRVKRDKSACRAKLTFDARDENGGLAAQIARFTGEKGNRVSLGCRKSPYSRSSERGRWG